MGNFFSRLWIRQNSGERASAASFTAQEVIPALETKNQTQTEADSSVCKQRCGRRADMAAEETVSPPLGFSSLQNTLKREVESGTASRSSEAAPSQQDKPSQAGEGGTSKPLSSTVPSTASGTVSKEGSQRGYRKKISRHERRRIEQEIRRKRKPALTVVNIRRVVQGLEWRRLGKVLRIPSSILDEISKEHTTDDQREAAVIYYWMFHDPLASWRRLTDNLHWRDEHDHTNRISHYAEELTDSSLTHLSVSTVLNSVSVEGMESCLMIPLSLRSKIAKQSESEEERRNALVHYWLKTSPYASWQWLSGWNHWCGKESAVSAAKIYVQRAPELTLTVDNLTSLLEGVKNLDRLSSVVANLHIPYSKRSEIQEQYSISQCRQEYCRYWLTHHPSPSWLVVADALYMSGEHGALEVLQKLYLKSTSESRRLLQEAMKYGSLQAYLSKMLLFGSAGVGKTCTKDIVAGFTPPDVRQSTPLATRPVTLYQLAFDTSKGIWKTFTSDNRMRFCAGIATSLRPEVQEAILEEDWSIDFNESSEASNVHTASHSQEMREQKYTDRSATPDSQPFREHPIAGVSSSEVKPLSSVDTKVAQVISDVFDKLFQLMDKHPEGDDRIVSLLHKLMIIDSGGQPQFHEVLPIFLRKMSLYAFVFKLPDDLSSYPPVEYFEKGEKVGKTYKSKHTTEQLFQHLLRTVHTHRSKGDKEKIKSRILLIGTHKDQLDTTEPIDEKNKRFSEILLPEFKEYVQYYNVATEKLVFPMNAKSPGNEEKAMVEKIRSLVTDECLPDPEDLPLQWLGLEIILDEITHHLGRGLLTKSECVHIASKLHFDESTLEAALMYLDELSLIFYYPQILPELVFTNPQVVLDKISELVKVHFDLMRDDTGPFVSCTIGDMWQEFLHYALVTVDFLSQERFKQHYVPGLFEPEHIVILFRKLLIFATFADNKLFVPCLLQMLDDAAVSELRISFQSVVPPLVLKFPNGGPRLGLFCSLMSFLTSTDLRGSPWVLKMKPNSIKPACLYRNCIQLTMTHASCSVMLIDAFTHFEVHVFATEKVCRKECPAVFQAILAGCQKAALNLGYVNSKPEPAFLCPCGSDGVHLATLVDEEWTCSLNEAAEINITANHQSWFKDDSSDNPGGPKVTIGDLQLLKYKDKDGKVERLRIIDRVSYKWKSITDRLSNNPSKAHSVSLQCNNDPAACLRELFLDCFINNKPANDYSQDWSGIIELLDDIEEEQLAIEVRNMIAKCFNIKFS